MKAHAVVFVMLCAALAGCGAEPPAEPTPAETAAAGDTAAPAPEMADSVRTAVGIARELEADPEAAEAILERHGMTTEEFDEMMYDIAADPELARQYREALRP